MNRPPAYTPLPLQPCRHAYPGVRRDDPLSLHIQDPHDPHRVKWMLEAIGLLRYDAQSRKWVPAVDDAPDPNSRRPLSNAAVVAALGTKADKASAVSDVVGPDGTSLVNPATRVAALPAFPDPFGPLVAAFETAGDPAVSVLLAPASIRNWLVALYNEIRKLRPEASE